MGQLVINLDSQNFSIAGPNWEARLDVWHSIPEGPLILDAFMDEEGVLIPVRLDMLIECGTLYTLYYPRPPKKSSLGAAGCGVFEGNDPDSRRRC